MIEEYQIVPMADTTPAPVGADALREALWICVEHNALHFGETHNTVVQGRAALASAAPPPAVQQGDALIDFIESAGSVRIHRVRAGFNGPIRWDIEYGYEDAKVSGRTLRDALSGVLKAGAASGAQGESNGRD